MKVFKLEVDNFRLLKKFSLDLEDELSLIIGKNNTGKTSVLSILDKFLNQPENSRFSFDDFNIEFSKHLKKIIEDITEIAEKDYIRNSVKLKLYISYTEVDNLANISRLMMDLDPENNTIVLGFEYTLDYFDYVRLRADFSNFKQNEANKFTNNSKYIVRDLNYFFKKNHSDYFKFYKKSLGFDKTDRIVKEDNFIDLGKEEISIKDVINFKYISARRDVTNKDYDKTLSRQTSLIYKRTEINEDQKLAVDDFKDTLSMTDISLTSIYSTLFSDVVDKVRDFGGLKINESEIEIISTLQHKELLEGNTTVVYKHNQDSQLPEHYNGLGYMNLISMIFEIEILVQEFKREKDKQPADINLLFIEEPEAHTHPQMQYIFIKNIKKLLESGIVRNDGVVRKIQYLISTHSSHIVADSDFNDIKYLKRNSTDSVVAKNLKDLEKDYFSNDGEEKNFRFLKQYLTLNRAELFFADKAIFIEGDTERLLLPAMMKKIDIEIPGNPILSQYISIIEVGAHSKIFEKFIDFIGIKKSLIITDIDSYYLKNKSEDDLKGQQKNAAGGGLDSEHIKCPVSDINATFTANSSLIYFHNGNKSLGYFKTLTFDWKILRKNRKKNGFLIKKATC